MRIDRLLDLTILKLAKVAPIRPFTPDHARTIPKAQVDGLLSTLLRVYSSVNGTAVTLETILAWIVAKSIVDGGL